MEEQQKAEEKITIIEKNIHRTNLRRLIDTLYLFIPIILAIVFSVGSASKILIIGSIYALTKMNSYIREIIGGISVDFNNNFSSMLNSFKK